MQTLKAQPVRWTIGVAAIAVIVVLFAPRPLGGLTSYVIVDGASMSPTFEEGDLVVVRDGEYTAGDVVAFQTGSGVVIHRIIGGSSEEGFILQGDNRANPDTWRPTRNEVLGERWFHIDGAGHRLRQLMGNPMMLGGVLGGLGTLMVWKPNRKLTRRHGAHRAVNPRRARTTSSAKPLPAAGMTLATLSGLLLLLGGASIYLYTQPVQRVVEIEETQLEHAGSHSYLATVEPSVVYEGTTITPDSTGEESTTIYTQLLDDLRIDFQYETTPHLAFESNGSLSSELRIGTGDNRWTRSLPLISSRTFNGTTVSESFTVDIPLLLSMIERAEQETGYSPRTYDLTVVTLVNITGASDSQIDEVLQVELPMELNDTRLTITNELSASESVTTSTQEVVPNEIAVLGLSLPVREMRTITGIALVGTLLATVAYGWVVRRHLGDGEAARIRLRYGSLIVPASGMSPNGTQRIKVHSINDLVRLARQAEQMVFYDHADGHTFSVPDGAVIYEYRITDKRRNRR